ncbi:MAG: GH1 family beta-glucosidase [Gemmatimonadota bacterium]
MTAFPSFPPGFLFGTATAAYQIEGAVAEDGRGPSIWDTFSHTPGAVYRGDNGDIACDHYHRWEADLDLLAGLGCRSYRFSIAWPRVLPAGQGPVNQRGLDFYRRLLDGLHNRGIEPMVTLYHWDLPQALQDQGGWPARDTAARFADYAAAVARELGDRVPLWITLNEPWVSAFAGHLQGRHAPGLADLGTALRAAHHLLLGHGLAVQALRAGPGGGRVGITLNLSDVTPASDDPADVAAAARMDGQANRWFLDPVLRGSYPADLLEWYAERADLAALDAGDLAVAAQPLDFLGVNFYQHQRIAADTGPAALYGARRVPHTGPVTHLGWAVEPAALGRLLRRVTRDYGPLPLYLTENGACYYDYPDPQGRVNDTERVDYLAGYFAEAAAAIADGVDLRGYYVWSLLDNFEWALGYLPRFGLVYVDYRTQERIPKASARWYADLIAGQAR